MDIIRKCDNCKVLKLERLPQEITQIRSKYPRERIIADLVDLRRYQNKNDDYGWLFVAVDAFSKYAFTFKLYKKTAEEVLACFKKILYTLGNILILYTDNCKEFCNNLVTGFCDENNTVRAKTWGL